LQGSCTAAVTQDVCGHSTKEYS